MLVLTRRPLQSIHIDKDIIVTVLEVKGDKVRLGFDAPKNVLILRDELIEPKTTQIPGCFTNGDEPID